MKVKLCDNPLNEKCLEDKKDVELCSSFKRKCKSKIKILFLNYIFTDFLIITIVFSNAATGIKRYCLRCDKIKKNLNIIRIGNKKEICEKCRSELLYQCIKCKRKSKNYSVMLYHWKHYCSLLRSKDSTFIVKLTGPEKFKNRDISNKIQRHTCQLCPYSTNLKNRLMLHLQMHSWKDIKSVLHES